MKQSKFQLISQRITNLEYTLNNNFSSVEIELAIEASTVSNHSDEECKAIVTLTLYIFKDQELAKVPFKIMICNQGIFVWDKSYSPETVEKLLKFNAPAVLLSNIRSVVSQITAYSGLQSLIIPLLDFTE
jgi:preprotein translocase subunit SecB